jgi:hypothetical protein
METWETVTMSRKEAPRVGLVKAALAGQITNAHGAHALGLSLRQFRRLKARYRAEGARGLVMVATFERFEAAHPLTEYYKKWVDELFGIVAVAFDATPSRQKLE